MLATEELRATDHAATESPGSSHAACRAVGAASTPQQPPAPITLPQPRSSHRPEGPCGGCQGRSPAQPGQPLEAATPKLSDYDRTALFHEFLRAERPLYDLAERYSLTPEQLDEFVNSPLIQTRIAIYKRLAAQQAEVTAALAKPVAIGTLKGLLDAHLDNECNQLVSPDHRGHTLQHHRRESARRTATRVLMACATTERASKQRPPAAPGRSVVSGPPWARVPSEPRPSKSDRARISHIAAADASSSHVVPLSPCTPACPPFLLVPAHPSGMLPPVGELSRRGRG
jgi:hypothetical protein